MSRFLKLKDTNQRRVLVATDSIAFITEYQDQCVLTLKGTGEEVAVKEGYQTLVNRLTKDDTPSAE